MAIRNKVIILLSVMSLLAVSCNKPNKLISTENNPAPATYQQASVPEIKESASEPASPNVEKPKGDTGESKTLPIQVKSFTVTGKNFSFSPSAINVNKGDKVKIHFINSNGFHDFVIDEFGAKTATIKTGEAADVEFLADKAGNFEFYCSVGNHRQLGMKGVLVVK